MTETTDSPQPPEWIFQQTLAKALTEMKVKLSGMQIEQVKSLFEMLAEANLQINLVGDASPEAVAIRHVADSLLLLSTDALEDREIRRAVDLGSGAGFPGLPLAIARPDIQWLLIESTGKKARFLEDVAFSLGLDNVAISGTRSEALAHNAVKREEYDLVVVRGVASAATLCELGLPFLKRGGRMIAYKGPDGPTELAQAGEAARLCGGDAQPIIHATLPVENHPRTFLMWDKVRPTPNQYPRREGVPRKSPLGM